jgi:hypothetical protein
MTDATLAELLDELLDADAPVGISEELAAYHTDIEVAADAGADVAAISAMRERFALTEPEHFEWAARKLARIRAQKARIEDEGAEQVYKLQALIAQRVKPLERDEDFFDGLIRAAVEALPADAKGKQAIKTLHLTASVTHREHFEWPEDDALVAWAHTTDSKYDLTRVKETPDKVAIKSYVKATGEAPDGLVIESVASVRLEVLA